MKRLRVISSATKSYVAMCSIWDSCGIAHLSKIGLNLHDEIILGIIVTDKREKLVRVFLTKHRTQFLL